MICKKAPIAKQSQNILYINAIPFTRCEVKVPNKTDLERYPVIPKYYYVPADFVEHEKRNPGSQKRFPSNCGRDGKLFLWGQALYIIAKLLGK